MKGAELQLHNEPQMNWRADKFNDLISIYVPVSVFFYAHKDII